MTKPFSVAFKQKMVQRLTGKDAVSATQLARETGVRQQNLSRCLEEARSLPIMVDTLKPAMREWTVEQKARVLTEAANLDGEELTAYLEREGVKLPDYEQWRIALDEGGRTCAATNRRIRQHTRGSRFHSAPGGWAEPVVELGHHVAVDERARIVPVPLSHHGRLESSHRRLAHRGTRVGRHRRCADDTGLLGRQRRSARPRAAL
jgi:hypothetical protein